MNGIVSIQQLQDASVDADNLDSIVNGAVDENGTGLVPIRGGGHRKTIAKALSDLSGYDPPVTFTSGLSVTSEIYTVENDGAVYAPRPAELPFTTTGTFDANQWYLVFRKNSYELDVVDFGADPTGSSSSDAAFAAAIALSQTTGMPLTGFGLFVISGQLDFGSANINMPAAVILLESGFTAADGYGVRFGTSTRYSGINDAIADPGPPISYVFPSASSPRQIVLNVWANRTEQSAAQVAVLLDDISMSSSQVYMGVMHAYTGVQANGETEKFFGHVAAHDCNLALHDRFDSTTVGDTVDEVNWTLSAHLCLSLYKVEGNCSTQVHIQSENNGTADPTAWSVMLYGNKTTKITGEIRGNRCRGIHVEGNDGTGQGNGDNNNVVLDIDFVAGSVGEILRVDTCRKISGRIGIAASDGPLVYIGDVTGGGLLDIELNGVSVNTGEWAIQLGDALGGVVCEEMSLRITAIAISEVTSATDRGLLKFDDTTSCDVYCSSLSGTAVDFDFNESRADRLSLPAKAVRASGIFPKFSGSGLGPSSGQPTIHIRGNLTLSELDSATFTPVEGMVSEAVANFEDNEGRYIRDAWVPMGGYIATATAADLADSAADVNTKGKFQGREYIVSGTNQRVFSNGAGAGSNWYLSDGTTAYNP